MSSRVSNFLKFASVVFALGFISSQEKFSFGYAIVNCIESITRMFLAQRVPEIQVFER